MRKKFEINWTKIKGSCQSGSKVVAHNPKSDLPLGSCGFLTKYLFPKIEEMDDEEKTSIMQNIHDK